MATLPLTHTDLRILSVVLADARRRGRLCDADHDRTVIILAAAGQRLRDEESLAALEKSWSL